MTRTIDIPRPPLCWSIPLLFCLLLLPSGARGQESSTLLFLDYQFGVPTDIKRSAGEISYCATCDGSGISQSHTGRIGIRVDLPEVRIAGLATFLGTSLHFANGGFRSNPYTVGRSVDTGVVTTEEEFTLRSLTAGVGLEGGLDLRLGRARGSVGLWGELRVAGYLVQQEEILSPSNATYEGTGTTRRIVREGSELSDEPVGYGLQGGIGLPIDLGDHLRLIPTLGTRIDLPALIDGIGFRAFSGVFRLGIDLDRPPPRPVPPTPPAVVTLSPPPPPPADPPVTVSLRLQAISGDLRSDTARIVLLRELRRLHAEGRTTEEVLERYAAPEIRVAPTMRSPAGVAWWGLTFRREGIEIARVTSRDPQPTLDLDLTPRMGGDPAASLWGEVVVEDSAGSVSAARAVLPVIIDSSISERPGEYSSVIDVWEVEPGMLDLVVDDVANILAGEGTAPLSITIICSDEGRTCPDAEDLRERLAGRYRHQIDIERGGEADAVLLEIVSKGW